MTAPARRIRSIAGWLALSSGAGIFVFEECCVQDSSGFEGRDRRWVAVSVTDTP